MKKTHKLRALGDVPAVLAAAGTVAEAARRLGVDQSSLRRWIRAGKLVDPRGPRATATPRAPRPVTAADDLLTPAEWEAAVLAEFDFSKTERQLLRLARRALERGLDDTLRPEQQCAFMGRFAALRRDLKIPENADGDAQETDRSARWPRPA